MPERQLRQPGSPLASEALSQMSPPTLLVLNGAPEYLKDQ